MAATSTLLTLKAMGSGNASAQNKWNVRNNSIESHKPVGAVSSNHQRSKLCSNTALSFGAAVKHPPLALPGNTHIGYSPRPLGLLPHKRKSDMWNELGVLMHSIAADKGGNTLLSSRLKARKTTSISSETFITTNATSTSGSRPTFSEAAVHIAPHNHYSDKVSAAARHIVDDPEYLNTLAQCDMKKYNVQVTSEQHHHTNWPAHQLDTGVMGGHRVLQFHSSSYTSSAVPVASKGKKYGRIMNNHFSKKSLEYLSFFGQAQLNKRTLFSDCRNSKEFEPCERCSLRGTRCGHCNAIRTGGGYIILDSLSALDYNLDFNGEGSLGLDSASNTNSRILKSSMSSRRSRRSDTGNNDEINYEETEIEDGFSSNTRRSTARDNRRMNVLRDDDTDGPSVGTNDLNQHGIGEYNRGMQESAGIRTDKSKDGPDSVFRDSSSDNYGVRNDGTDILFNGTGNDRGYTDDDTKHEAIGSDHLIDRLQQREDSSAGKDGHFNNGGSDTLPESLINGDSQKQTNEQNGIGREGIPHGGNRQVLKKDYRQKNISNPSRVNFADDDSTMDTELNGRTATSDNTKSVTGGTVHGGSENTNERQGSARYHGDLMKFRSKKDRVRAKSCTLRELKGIDPLDYLAKYCIIDQEKVPHYQRVFENVDMDEDGEINVAELDFALKAVNYNLISDAELLFVNKVLELAGRYALNFQLFTLVAALSEKVVSLEDMVKRLVNEMDFEALETKMKKCKELFYLLANHNDDGEDGVVTTSALGIELQAGGLTEEHVQYVINHLEHEDKGTVEFLDYLVYVPLFVEIHGSINDNPLNFARTK